jgi:3-hydroxyisobutyrate dehydrogenase-like beta-hydroxyacid dehydrogenase
MNLAFLGLGAMGEPMARNLVAAGHSVTVYNRTPGRASALVEMGATEAASAPVAVAAAEMVLSCVSTPEALRELLLGQDGAMAAAPSGTLFVDFSTGDPSTSKALAAIAETYGSSFLEAPVSGGVKGAAGGTLTVMVGGSEEDLARAQPVLDILASSVVRVGEVGSASAAKLINQMLVGVHLTAALEAYAVGTRAGVDPQVLQEIITNSTGDSFMFRRVSRNLFAQDFAPGFKLDLLAKDLRLAAEMCEQSSVSHALVDATRGIVASAQEAGLGEQDVAIMATILPGANIGSTTDSKETSA